MSTPSKPARPILGLALVLIGLWGGFYLMSLLDPDVFLWWYAPYALTVVPAACGLIGYGVNLTGWIESDDDIV